MTRLALASLLVTFSLGSTACLDIAEALLGGYNQPSNGQSGANSDCHEAVAVCDDFVTTFCSRTSACGLGLPFAQCKERAESTTLPCDKAVAADDFTQCDADVTAESCDDLGAGKQPASCVPLHFQFGTAVCQ